MLTSSVTPGISAQEYHERRTKLAASLPDNAIAILPSSHIKYRSGAVFYEFHQESNFFYLTGFNEPESLAVIQKIGPAGDYIFHLFVRPKNAHAELWDGARSGEQAAIDVFNADKVRENWPAIHDLADNKIVRRYWEIIITSSALDFAG